MAVLMKSILIVLCMVTVAYVAEAAISCARVGSTLSPCIPYAAVGKVSTPPSACCAGIKSLNDAAKTTPERQAVCNCLKSFAHALPNINYNLVEGLPGQCGVHIPYRINPSTNCKSVK